MIACPSPKELEEYLQDELADPRFDEVAEHLDDCASCLQRLSAIVDGGTVPSGQPPASDDAVILDKIKKMGPPAARKATADDDWPAAVGPYTIEKEIARGGMGQVLRARDPKFDRSLAVKLLLPKYQNDAGAAQRFLQEAQLTGKLQHPGIPPVHDVGEAGGRPFFAMKLIDGQTLAALLKARPTPKAEMSRFLGIFEQIAQAVGYAHERGVIHRDLKPQNVMVGEYGEVQVMDWGLAKQIRNRQSATESAESGNENRDSDTGTTGCESEPACKSEPAALARPAPIPQAAPDPQRLADTIEHQTKTPSTSTRAGDVFGTYAYMPPEQARGEVDQIDERSDVFGLGAVLCVILTGKPPYDGEVQRQARDADLSDAESRLQSCGADAELIELARRCLVEKREKRPANGDAVAQEINDYLEAVQERLQREREEKAKVVVKMNEERKRRILTGVLAAVLLVFVIAAGSVGWWYRLQQIDAERRHERNEQEIRFALEKAAGLRVKLREDLTKPGGVFVLLNDLSQWEARINEAKIALKQAQKRFAENERISANLAQEIRSLESLLEEDHGQLKLANRLDVIRMERANSGGKEERLEHVDYSKEYTAAFALAGMDVLNGEPNETATKIRNTDIKEQLVAALDNWAFMAQFGIKSGQMNLKKTLTRVLHIARLADPNPWRDKVRDEKVWQNHQLLFELARTADFARQSPQVIGLLSYVLPAKGDKDIKLMESALKYHPRDFWLYYRLGTRLKNTKEAMAYLRVAVALFPTASAAHNNFGVALENQGNKQDAEFHFRNALKWNPKNFMALTNLGRFLEENGQLDAAGQYFLKALEIHKGHPLVHNNFGVFLQKKGETEKAIFHYKRALALDPQYGRAYANLADALRAKGDIKGAQEQIQKAITFSPNLIVVQTVLGLIQKDLGNFAAAKEAFGRALKQSKGNPAYHAIAQKNFDLSKQLLALDQRLSTVLKGQVKPKDDLENLELAAFCIRWKKYYAAAVRFLKAAHELQPQLADDVKDGSRHAAARAAVLAAAGQGRDAKQLAADEKISLRKQALAWLQADLKRWEELLSTDMRNASMLEKRMTKWQRDPQLASVRDATQFAALPMIERSQWQKLWATVGSLRTRAKISYTDNVAESKPLFQFRGNLKSDDPPDRYPGLDPSFFKTHTVKLQSGKSYQIDLQGNFDTLLRIEDEKENGLLHNDDVCRPSNLNSRIIFTPVQTGDYRLIARSFMRNVTGEYTLHVREVTLHGKPQITSGELNTNDQKRAFTPVDKAKKRSKFFKVHTLPLHRGSRYTIELESRKFDTFLILADPDKKVRANNDDIAPNRTNLSRIDFTPAYDGVYYLFVTSYQAGETGSYTLRILRYIPKSKEEK